MRIIAFDNYSYLVKTNNADNNCYLVDTKLKAVLGYDDPFKFMRFGNYREFDYKKSNKQLEKLIKSILNKNI